MASLAKWLSVRLQTKWLWVRIPLQSVNIYIIYKISKNYNISSYPTLENCLFGAVSLTKHVDIDQYKYSGYGIGFDRKGEFSFGRNVLILGADMSSSFYANNETEKDLYKD